MKSGKIGLIACLITLMACGQSFSQIVGAPARPAPTGQVPKAYTGQPARPYSQYQPKPTGQIQPAAAPAIPQGNNTQNTESIHQNTQQAAPVTSQEIITVPQQVQTNQQIQTTQPTGEVPKMNTNQDSRTVPSQSQIIIPANPQSVPGQIQTVPQRTNANATP
ncbi:hypothetical protein [Dyadobacter bucti]|uniref:hypothetical protein n=1 Tax=Dyadobacter bucti TaxID=2572203 RepID=UPI003F6FF041